MDRMNDIMLCAGIQLMLVLRLSSCNELSHRGSQYIVGGLMPACFAERMRHRRPADTSQLTDQEIAFLADKASSTPANSTAGLMMAQCWLTSFFL